METQKAEEKKVWTKPKLVVYGDIEKLTNESFGMPPKLGGSGYS